MEHHKKVEKKNNKLDFIKIKSLCASIYQIINDVKKKRETSYTEEENVYTAWWEAYSECIKILYYSVVR